MIGSGLTMEEMIFEVADTHLFFNDLEVSILNCFLCFSETWSLCLLYLEEMPLDRVGMEKPAGHLRMYKLARIVLWLGHRSLDSGCQFFWLRNLIFVCLFGNDLALGEMPTHPAKH